MYVYKLRFMAAFMSTRLIYSMGGREGGREEGGREGGRGGREGGREGGAGHYGTCSIPGK